MDKMKMSHATALALLAAASYVEAAPSRRKRHTEAPRREPVQSKPQPDKREPTTDEDKARIQAAAERRKRRNAKLAGRAE